MTDASNPMLTRRSLLHAGLLFGAGGAVGGLAAGPVLGRGGLAGAATPIAGATATRQAELEELRALQTQVAEPIQCTPAPTEPPAPTETPIPPTPTATVVPATASGEPTPYGEEWIVTVLGIAHVPAAGEHLPEGQFIRVNVTIQNLTNDALAPPFTDWMLVTTRGQAYDVDLLASNDIAGVGWGLNVGAGETADRALVFDVPADAGTSFVLESRREPSFRVSVALQSFG